MPRIEKLLSAIRRNQKNVKYSNLEIVCNHYFGEARQRGTSHLVYKTPWPGDPRVNIQKGKGGEAKVYQVRQVLAAIDKIEGLDNDES